LKPVFAGTDLGLLKETISFKPARNIAGLDRLVRSCAKAVIPPPDVTKLLREEPPDVIAGGDRKDGRKKKVEIGLVARNTLDFFI